MSHHEVGDRLPLFQSPLLHEEKGSVEERAHESEDDAGKNEEPAVYETNDEDLHSSPKFHRHSEATNAELFYDLFFVANLTVFTQVHEVNDARTLEQYVGFFCILWFTWYQVGLYDVRFSMDSAFERIAKACQFGVMIGFAITGPNFAVGSAEEREEETGESPVTAFRALSLILMVSRLVLVFQYLQSMYFTRQYKRTQLPMAIIAATYFISAMVYLGLFFTFREDIENRTYIVWYIIAILETISTTAVSSVWRVISFKGTHLVQRMSLLTLIILGEGVMALSEKCQSIVESTLFEWNSSTIANVFCYILMLYFLYMLYFDWIQEEHFGTIRQQVWAFLHFPLHLALVLAVEGAAQSLSWGAAMSQWDDVQNELDGFNLTDSNNTIYDSVYKFTAAQWQSIASTANATTDRVMNAALTNSKDISSTYALIGEIESMKDAVGLAANGSQSQNATLTAVDALFWTYDTLENAILELAGFSPAENDTNIDSDFATVNFSSDATFQALEEETDKIVNVFILSFVYFFVAIGVVVLLCTAIATLSKKEKRAVHWVRLGMSYFIGVALCLIAAVATAADSSSSDAFANFADGPWVLPVVMLALFAVVLLNSIRFPKHHLPTLVRMRTRSVGGIP